MSVFFREKFSVHSNERVGFEVVVNNRLRAAVRQCDSGTKRPRQVLA